MTDLFVLYDSSSYSIEKIKEALEAKTTAYAELLTNLTEILNLVSDCAAKTQSEIKLILADLNRTSLWANVPLEKFKLFASTLNDEALKLLECFIPEEQYQAGFRDVFDSLIGKESEKLSSQGLWWKVVRQAAYSSNGDQYATLLTDVSSGRCVDWGLSLAAPKLLENAQLSDELKRAQLLINLSHSKFLNIKPVNNNEPCSNVDSEGFIKSQSDARMFCQVQ